MKTVLSTPAALPAPQALAKAHYFPEASSGFSLSHTHPFSEH